MVRVGDVDWAVVGACGWGDGEGAGLVVEGGGVAVGGVVPGAGGFGHEADFVGGVAVVEAGDFEGFCFGVVGEGGGELDVEEGVAGGGAGEGEFEEVILLDGGGVWGGGGEEGDWDEDEDEDEDNEEALRMRHFLLGWGKGWLGRRLPLGGTLGMEGCCDFWGGGGGCAQNGSEGAPFLILRGSPRLARRGSGVSGGLEFLEGGFALGEELVEGVEAGLADLAVAVGEGWVF